MKFFKRNWKYKGIGETHSLFLGKIWVHVWQCSLTNKIKTKKV